MRYHCGCYETVIFARGIWLQFIPLIRGSLLTSGCHGACNTILNVDSEYIIPVSVYMTYWHRELQGFLSADDVTDDYWHVRGRGRERREMPAHAGGRCSGITKVPGMDGLGVQMRPPSHQPAIIFTTGCRPPKILGT